MTLQWYYTCSQEVPFKDEPQVLHRVDVWRLSRPLHDLDVHDPKPLLSLPGLVFRVVVLLKDKASIAVPELFLIA